MVRKNAGISRGLFVPAALFAALCLASCERQSAVRSVTEDTLFTLDYGNFEGQLNLFSVTDVGDLRTAMTMHEGFFYIVNGEADKILSFNSFGDLLAVYGNEESGAAALSSAADAGVWKPVLYPFSFTGKIAVDSRKYIYAVGTVPGERNEQSEDENLLYSHVILRVAGDTVDYIGQQGPLGTPFPFVRDIYTTSDDELVVVCVTNTGLCAYWFNREGFLVYKIPVNTQGAPLPASVSSSSAENDVFLTVENVIPDRNARRLYVKIDYYLPYIDRDSKVQSGVNYTETLVYPLDVSTGVYDTPVSVPPYEESVTEDFSRLTYRLPYDFLGVTKSGWLFFIIVTQDGFSVEMIQPGTRRVLRRSFEVSHSDVLYYSLSLSDGGIISAMLAERDGARVVWWRTDSLIESILKL